MSIKNSLKCKDFSRPPKRTIRARERQSRREHQMIKEILDGLEARGILSRTEDGKIKKGRFYPRKQETGSYYGGLTIGGGFFGSPSPSSFCGRCSGSSSSVVNTNAQRRLEQMELERASIYNLVKARGRNKEGARTENNVHPLGVFGPLIFSPFSCHGPHGPIIINLLTTELIETGSTLQGLVSYLNKCNVTGECQVNFGMKEEGHKIHNETDLEMGLFCSALNPHHHNQQPSPVGNTITGRILKGNLPERDVNAGNKVVRVSERRLEQDETDIVSRIIQLEQQELGRAPCLDDLLCRFSREELDIVWDSITWIYPHLKEELVLARC